MAVTRFATHLWFDSDALEAAELYTSLVPGSRIERVTLAPEGVPDTSPGSPFLVDLVIGGQAYVFLNGGPQFPFDSQVSLYLRCETQEEVDHYWSALLAGGGHEVQCGWLTDRFGLSWQIIPARLEELIGSGDQAVARRVTEAMLGMVKIDIAGLEAAAASS